MSPFPPIEELLPHRGSMLLLDRVISTAENSLRAIARVSSNAWYTNDNGNMPAWIGLELMAQTVAAYAGLDAQVQGSPIKKGLLLGTRNFQSAVAEFPAGAKLEIVANLVFREDNGLGAFACQIEKDNVPLSSATLKVYEPPDFGEFIRERSSS